MTSVDLQLAVHNCTILQIKAHDAFVYTLPQKAHNRAHNGLHTVLPVNLASCVNNPIVCCLLSDLHL